jgi:hypothetical protein
LFIFELTYFLIPGIYTYSHTVRYPNSHGQRLQIRRIISGREYISLLSQRDPDRKTIKKQRRRWEIHP